MKFSRFVLVLLALPFLFLNNAPVAIGEIENTQTIILDTFLSHAKVNERFEELAGRVALEKQNNAEISRANVDNFPEAWTIKFSKFRSKHFNPNTPPEQEREVSSSWMKFITAPSNLPDDPYLASGIPRQIREVDQDILAIKGRWDFKGYNWLIIEPSYSRSAGFLELIDTDADNTDNRNFESPYFIRLFGVTESIDLWVWGAMFKYNLEIQIEDYLGNTHILPGGTIDFKGWRNIRFTIPGYIPQKQKYLPNLQPLRFTRLKITTNPQERVDNFYVYFDYMQSIANTYEEVYFGNRLEKSNPWLVGGDGAPSAPSNP